MAKKKNSVGRTIVQIFLGIILTFALIVLLFCVSSVKRLSGDYKAAGGELTKAYYANVKETFHKNLNEMSAPTGMGGETLEGIASDKKIESDVDAYITSVLKGNEFTADTTEMMGLTDAKVREYFAGQNIVMGESQENALQQYKELVDRLYQNSIKVSEAKKIYELQNDVRNMLKKARNGAVLVSMAAVILLIIISRPKYTGLRYMIYSIAAAGTGSVILPIYILKSSLYKKIPMIAETLNTSTFDYAGMLFKPMPLNLLISAGIILILLIVIKISKVRENVIKIT